MIELAVIGGGPAGLTAALYAARAGRSVAVFEGSGFGGQITLSPLVENYPGLGAVSGMELGDRMYAQAEAAGAELTFSGVQRIERNTDGMFLLETEDGVHEFTIFAVACVDKLDSWYSFINAESEDAFNEAVQRIIQNAYYTNGDAPEYGDRLLTLSTCYGSTRSSRLIIIAKEEKANVWKTEIADAGTDGGNSDEGLLRYDFTRLREILVRPLCCWRQLPICVGYPRISPLH